MTNALIGVYLTEQGRSIEPYVRSVLQAWVEIITEGFTKKEKETAYNLLHRMAEKRNFG